MIVNFQILGQGQVQPIQGNIDTRDTNHLPHIGTSPPLTTLLEDRPIIAIETTPEIEVDQEIPDLTLTRGIPSEIETDLILKQEIIPATPDPTPEDGAIADQGMKDPALKDETTTGANHQTAADHLPETADQFLQQCSHITFKVGVKITSTTQL